MAKEMIAPTSKSDRVRQYLARKPTASVKQIVTDLEPYGISEALADKIKYSERRGALRPTAKKPRTATPAASSAGGTKAEAIRDVAKGMEKPFRPRDVRDVLATQGIDASTTQIGQVLRSMGMRRKRRRKATAAGGTPAAGADSAGLNINDLVAAKKLVGQVGSIEKVREALAALARLS